MEYFTYGWPALIPANSSAWQAKSAKLSHKLYYVLLHDPSLSAIYLTSERILPSPTVVSPSSYHHLAKAID